MDRYSRTIAIIQRHLPDTTDDDAAALADWIRRSYGVKPAMLGAYARRMALAGDLAGALAELQASRRTGTAPAPTPGRPTSLIAMDQRANKALSGDQRAQAMQAVRAEIRPGPRTTQSA